MDNRNFTLLTDFYEITMMQGYFKNHASNRVVFDLFYRQNPDDGAYAVCAGLAQVIDYVKSLHFDYEDIDYGMDASEQNFGEQLFDKLEAAGFTPEDPDLPTVDASQDTTAMDTLQNFEYPEYDDSQDYDPFENFRDYGSMD